MCDQITTIHRVKHTPAAYLVIDPAGQVVARYPFNADDFHGSRRVAYREALEDAAVRDEALAAAEGRAWAEEDDAATVEAALREIPSDLRAARIERCAVGGDCMVLDQLGRVLYRGAAVDCEGWLAAVLDTPDDDPPPPAAGGARVVWRWQGTAKALQALLSTRRAA